VRKPVDNLHTNRFTWRVFLAAFILRLIPVLLARSIGIGLDDMFQYDMVARSLASGNGFRWYASADLEMLKPYVDFDLSSVDYDPVRGVETSFRAPLYPAFLSLIYLLVASGTNRFFVARLAQTILGAALAPLTYLVAHKLIPGNERAAKISAWVVAAYPILLAYPLGLGTENPFFLLLLASFLFLVQSIEQPSAFHFLISGFLLGLTALTRSVILPFAGLAILWIWFTLKQKRGALLAFLALALTISPWILRNSLLHHKLTGIETSMGYNLYLGYHPQGNGSFIFGPSLDLLTILDDAERDQVGTQKAFEFIRNEPDRFLPLVVNRLGFFFGLEKRVLIYFYGNNIVGFIPFPALLALLLVMLLPFTIVSISAALGTPLLRRNPPTILFGLLLFAYLLPHVLILSEDRFHLALIPFFAILASLFWTSGIKSIAVRWNKSHVGKVIVILALIVILLLLLNWCLELSRDADKILQLLGPNGNFSNFPY
jgi:Dolichyl-phosphate-mannose-protein mannosyltransferase